MYLTLAESYVRWLEFRGNSTRIAQLIAALGLSAMALVNTLSAFMLAQALGGPRLLVWFSRYPWVAFPAFLAFAVAHWLLCRRIRPADPQPPRAPSRVWWTTYVGATFIVWILASALTLGLMTTGRTCVLPGGRCGI